MCASIRITTTRGTKLTLSADQRIMVIYDKAECKGKNNLSFLLTMTLFDLRATSRSKHVAAPSADPGLYSYLLKKKKHTNKGLLLPGRQRSLKAGMSWKNGDWRQAQGALQMAH